MTFFWEQVGPEGHPYNPFPTAMTIGRPQPTQPQLPFGGLYLRKHSPMEAMSSLPSSSVLPHGLPHSWNPQLSYLSGLSSPHPAFSYRGSFLNPAITAAAYLPGGPPSFQNLLASLHGASSAAAAAAAMASHGHPVSGHGMNSSADLLMRSPLGQGIHSPLGGSTASPELSPERGGAPRKSSPTQEITGGNEFHPVGSLSDPLSLVGAEDLNRRTSSINALRVRAKEHEMKLKILQNSTSDVVTN